MKKNFLLFFLFTLCVINSIKRCLYWEGSKNLKIGCAIFPFDSFVNIERVINENYFATHSIELKWYFNNQRILEGIDKRCNNAFCHFRDELFMFEKNKIYNLFYNGTHVIIEDFISEQNKNCFSCFVNLFE